MMIPTDTEDPSRASTVTKAQPTPVRRRNNLSALTSAHLFGTAEKAPTAVKTAPETRLNLVLRGVLAAESPNYASAIIASGKNGKEEFYGIGDSVPGGAKLHEVHPEHVILDRKGQLETLKLTKEKALSSVAMAGSRNKGRPGSPPSSLGDIRKNILRNPTSFGDYALPIIVKENGKQVGYRLQIQKKGKEFLEKAGLQASDVITSINGVKLDNPQNGISALRKLGSANALNITVKRNGNEVPLSIQLQ